MSSAVRVILSQHRPRGFTGRGDKYLAEVAQALRRLLARNQQALVRATSRLPEGRLNQLAALLVEFAEDIHNDIGLWRTLESFNQATFGHPLPLTDREARPDDLKGFDSRRIRHLLWGLWGCLDPEKLPSPTHPDLRRVAEVVSPFLTESFARIPRDSGVKRFLGVSDHYGWDVKRKLVWLGTQSYLFGPLFPAYVEGHGGDPSVATADDFICQHCTPWSGLGATDILAGALDVPDADRETLRHWYERHTAPYRVLSRQDRGNETETIQVCNLVNGQPYTVRVNMPDSPFQPGDLVFGGLTPWRGEWYWSGEQQKWDKLSPAAEADLRKEMLEKNSAISYRYCPERAAFARESVGRHYARFLEYYGDDLVVFPDGLSAAAAEQKKMEAEWQAAPPEKVARLMAERGLTRPCPPMRFPPGFLECDNGIGSFFNPAEGQEYMREFNPVLAGFRKRGQGLTEAEMDGIRHLIESYALSPAFVLRLVQEYGAESIGAAYSVRDFDAAKDLAYLLRRHKGHFYRNRYPSLSLIGEIASSVSS
jgi:hypothetical protein